MRGELRFRAETEMLLRVQMMQEAQRGKDATGIATTRSVDDAQVLAGSNKLKRGSGCDRGTE